MHCVRVIGSLLIAFPGPESGVGAVEAVRRFMGREVISAKGLNFALRETETKRVCKICRLLSAWVDRISGLIIKEKG